MALLIETETQRLFYSLHNNGQSNYLRAFWKFRCDILTPGPHVNVCLTACWWRVDPTGPWCHRPTAAPWCRGRRTRASWRSPSPSWTPPKEPRGKAQDVGRRKRSPAYSGVRPSCSEKNTHLQTVVADQAEQRDDGVEHSQEAQSRQHVAGALLQDELVHVEECVLVVLVVATPAVLTVFLLVALARDLNSKGILRFTPQASQARHFIFYLQMHFHVVGSWSITGAPSRAHQTAACCSTAASTTK